MLDALLVCLRARYTHTAEGGDFAVVYQNQRLYVAFEWSDGIEDWKNNLTFFSTCVNPHAPKEMRWYAHSGFLRVWQGMKEQVISSVAWYLKRYFIKEIICVGYSHGAAISLLATQAMSEIYGREDLMVSGYGFGSPRVVKKSLPPHVKEHLNCFVTVRNRHDIVTYLPPKLFGFVHVGLCEIGVSGGYGVVEAHRAENYIASLEQEKDTPQRLDTPGVTFSYGGRRS